MNTITTKLVTATERFILSKVKNNSLFAEYVNRTDKKAPWKKQTMAISAKEIKDWINAIMSATDPLNPRRGDLMRFYQNCKSDLHLVSCIDTRILPIQCAAFKLVDANNNEDTEAHKLLEKPWYLELVRLICEYTYEGTKLIEIFELNEKGELKEVTEIPQSNFIAKDGIIINEEWDNNGVSYKEGVYKDYYFQVGNDWNLGVLSQTAMIVLAKKLGLGSWMSYIDKFGVPPIFAITERMDTTRRDELYEMLENFRMNHFMVLQGKEKIEIPNNYSVDAYNSFKELAELCNSEISKRILGGTGTMDEKSFVGAVEIHKQMLKYRNQVDKLLFKFYFNEEVKPRLVKLSSVYAPLANLTFEFDETETLSLKEILEAIKSLSQYYEFDIDELVRITGLPITALRKALGNTNEPTTEQKKKPNASVDFGNLSSLALDTNKITAATWDKSTENAAKQIYAGERTAVDLDNDIVLKNYATLYESSKAAWGKDFYVNDNARKMRDNLMKFAGAKAYNMLSQIEALKSNKLSEDEFITEAKAISSRFNGAYIDAEKQYTSASSAAAKDWEQFKKDEDIYPNLKCRTRQDDDVRDSHAALDGLVKKISDWKTTPPFDPRCRCWLEQTLEPVSSVIPTINQNVQYANNPGVTGKVFTDLHSYFVNIKKGHSTAVVNNTNALKQYAPYNKTIETKGGNNVIVNDFADTTDLIPNITAAKIVADTVNKDIYILPHIDTNKNIKNPEYGIGKTSVLGDLKTYNPIVNNNHVSITNFINNSLKSANKQKCKYIIIDVSNVTTDDFKLIPNKLRGDLNNTQGTNKNIKNVIIINGNKTLNITRDEINSKKYAEYFNK